MNLTSTNYLTDSLVLYEQVVSRFDEFENILVSNGIRLSPGSRFMLYKRKLSQYADEKARKQRKDIRDVKIINQAVYEIEEVITIIQAFQSHPETFEWKKYIRRMLMDSDFPENDKKESPGRDLQFELFTAALCKQAGFSVRLAEPDVIVNHPDMDFCIAAKRIKSSSKIRRRISEARKQIVAVTNGMICLDLSTIYNPSNSFLLTSKSEEAPLKLQEFANEFIHQNSQRIREIVKREERVFGLMVFVGAIYFDLLTRQSGPAMCLRATNLCDISDWRTGFIQHFMADLAKSRMGIQQ